ncbi:MAG: YbaB/EbfC family nucleoid-associated protein [Polyangia bacterium]
MAKGRGRAFRGGLSGLMKQANRIQKKLETVKEELREQSWTAEAGGGKVKVTITGGKEITDISIDEELVNPEDVETLQDVVVSAVNAAVTLAEEKIEEASEGVTGGMHLPGMF